MIRTLRSISNIVVCTACSRTATGQTIGADLHYIKTWEGGICHSSDGMYLPFASGAISMLEHRLVVDAINYHRLKLVQIERLGSLDRGPD